MRDTKSHKSHVSFPYPSPTYCKADIIKAEKAAACGHIIHKNHQTKSLIRNRLLRLGLIPPTMEFDSEMNVIPPSLPTAGFESDTWTVYPCEQSLLHCISLEQHHLLLREKTIMQGNLDPGRPAYDQSYASFPTLSIYDVWQLSKDPYQLDDYLSLNVNTVVRMKTGVLAKILSKDQSLDKRSFELGRYLMLLWDSTPLTFRSKQRPSYLPHLPKPPPDLQGDDSPFHNSSSSSSLESLSSAPQASTASSASIPSTHPNSSQISNLVMLPSPSPNPVSKPGSSGRFTSNEWALVCFGANLGGPVWNYNELARPSSPDFETPPPDEQVMESTVSWWNLGCVVSWVTTCIMGI